MPPVTIYLDITKSKDRAILEALLTKDNPNESICTRIQKATDRMLAKIPTFNISGTN